MTVPRLNTKGRFDAARLFHPESIVVLGAETEAGASILANLLLAGFKGQVHTTLKPGTHLAILAVPEPEIPDALDQAAAAGCFAAIVPGPCASLAEHSARTGVRVLGPHAFGMAIPSLSLNATGSHIPPPPGRLALISQSAALARSIIDWAAPNGVGFSHIVGLGANAGIGFSLTLDWLSRDSRTGAILLDIRRLKNHRQFLSAARAAARLRPVVAVRPGLRLLDGDGNTGLTFEAALRRVGVLTVDRLEDLLAAAETLSRTRPLRKDTLAIVSNALGPGRLAADSAIRHGLPRPHMHLVPTETLSSTAFTLANAPEAGGVLVIHAPGQTNAIDALGHPPKDLKNPILTCAMGETTGAAHRAALASAGMAVFATPDQAILGFSHLVQDRRNREAARELPPRDVLTFAPDKQWAQRIFAAAHDGHLTQDQALDVLSAYGIPVIPTRPVTGPTDAADAAALLGYPVVIKQRTDQPPEDRPPGALIFDLHDRDAVIQAARLLRRRGDGCALLVQRHAGRSRELAIRMRVDPNFGPVIGVGPGGTQILPCDEAIDLPPLNLPLARSLLTRSPIGAALEKPLRDRPAANAAAIAATLVRISQLIVDFPDIAALQIPSLFADTDGVIAADAWIRLRAPDEPLCRLAIAPYPAHLIEHRILDGEKFTIRPIRPEDAQAHTEFFSRLSPEDIRYRFFSSMRELSPEMTARLTQVDYDREMAFIAIREATSDTVGVARLACEPGCESGEFAVIVQADMKGRGLASHLMDRLKAWAKLQGMKRITGQILADNHPMLSFIRHQGFSLHRMPDDPEVMEAEITL